jgi:hypothetical protein
VNARHADPNPRSNLKDHVNMSTAARKPPSPRQVQEEQERVRSADETRAKAPNLPSVVEAKLPASDTGRAFRDAYLDAIAPATIAGKMVKFSKDGENVVVEDKSVIGEDVDFIALCPETLIGHVRFDHDGVKREMGLLYDGYQMVPRESLGDTDPSQWETGLDGQPADPWVHAVYLVLQRVDNSELFTFVAMSKTSRRAVGTLLRHYDRMQRTHKGYLPIVRLKVGGYQHRDPRVGWVKTPVIAAVGQVPSENAVKPAPADFNDDIPY